MQGDSELTGRERNGLDLSCRLVLILATTERWTSRRYRIALLSLPLSALGGHETCGRDSDHKDHQIRSHPQLVRQPVSESRDRESQTIKLSHRLVKLPQFTHKGRGRGGDTTIQNEWPAEPGPESRSSGTSLACYPSCHPLEVRAVASGYPLSLPFEVWAIQEYF